MTNRKPLSFIPRTIVRPALLIVSALAFAGCGYGLSTLSTAGAERPITLYGVAGDSKSELKGLPRSVKFLASIITSLRKCDSFRLWAVDNACEEIASDPVPSNYEKFATNLVGALRQRSGEPTRTDKFWSLVAPLAEKCDRPFAVVLSIDGYTEGVDAEGHRRIAESAKILAHNPQLMMIAVVGALPGTRERIREDLAAVGNKLRFFDADARPKDVLTAISAGAAR